MWFQVEIDLEGEVVDLRAHLIPTRPLRRDRRSPLRGLPQLGNLDRGIVARFYGRSRLGVCICNATRESMVQQTTIGRAGTFS